MLAHMCVSLSFQYILFSMCAANELFFCMLYLCYFTSGPVGKFAFSFYMLSYFLGVGNNLSWRVIMKYFLRSFSPFH